MDVKKISVFAIFVGLYNITGAFSPLGIGAYTKPLIVSLFWEILPINLLFGYLFFEYLILLPLRVPYWISMKILYMIPFSTYPDLYISKIALANPSITSILIGISSTFLIRFYYPWFIANLLEKTGFYERIKERLGV